MYKIIIVMVIQWCLKDVIIIGIMRTNLIDIIECRIIENNFIYRIYLLNILQLYYQK